LADDATTDHDSDKTGLWGLVGLLGLLGLTGLKRRNDPAAVAPGGPGYGTAPRT
jgi:MYXO-CTERM domain-containing protein